eukprot:1188532-Prorocentrum_minimum.AAC.1
MADTWRASIRPRRRPRCKLRCLRRRTITTSGSGPPPATYALSSRPIGPPCGHMPSPLVRMVHPAGICPLLSSDWSTLRAYALSSAHSPDNQHPVI